MLHITFSSHSGFGRRPDSVCVNHRSVPPCQSRDTATITMYNHRAINGDTQIAINPEWVFKRSRRYQQKPPTVDSCTQIDERTLQGAHNAQGSAAPDVSRTAQPSATLQQQFDAANRADASIAGGHVHQGEGSSLTDRLPVIEEADEETLTSPPYPDDRDEEYYDDVSRSSLQLSASSPLIDAWGPRTSVKIRTPDENDVQEIQRRKSGRLTAVTTDPRQAVLLEIIECPHTRAFVPLTPQSTAIACQKDF